MTKRQAAAKVVMLNDEGKVLVLRRSETHPRKPHHTDLPGGIVDDGEIGVQALVREVQEETGVMVEPTDCIPFYAATWYAERTDKSFTMELYFIQFAHTPEVTISWEHESYEWCTFDELLAREDLEQPERTAIEYALRYDILTT